MFNRELLVNRSNSLLRNPTFLIESYFNICTGAVTKER